MRQIKEFEQIIGQLSLLGRGQRADGGDFHVPITHLSSLVYIVPTTFKGGVDRNARSLHGSGEPWSLRGNPTDTVHYPTPRSGIGIIVGDCHLDSMALRNNEAILRADRLRLATWLGVDGLSENGGF